MMNRLIYEAGKKKYQVQLKQARHISIPLNFDGAQASHYGAPRAQAEPMKIGDFIGSKALGGSCNVEQITFIPHCNGTHTECLGHITKRPQSVHECLQDALIPASLVTLRPVLASNTCETYIPNRGKTDLLITADSLKDALGREKDCFSQAVIIRTLPNGLSKKSASYGEVVPPFLSFEAMQYLVKNDVKHLLVDFPSIDKMHDQGMLNNHHVFWGLSNQSDEPRPHFLTKTITEMIYVCDDISDGKYLLNLQIPSFMSDAAPSRPILYPLVELL